MLHCETYGVHRFGKQVLNIWKRGYNYAFFWHFPTRKSTVFPFLSSGRIRIFVPLSSSFPSQLTLRKRLFFLVLRMRYQMGKQFVFVAYWCFPVTEDCFYRRFSVEDRAFSSTFQGQENAKKTCENHLSSNVHGLVNVKKCHVFWRFLAVCVEKTRCYRRFTECSYSHAFSSSCRSIIVQKMVFIPIFIGVLHH